MGPSRVRWSSRSNVAATTATKIRSIHDPAMCMDQDYRAIEARKQWFWRHIRLRGGMPLFPITRSNKLISMARPPLYSGEQGTRKEPSTGRARQFWQRVTEGMELSQLWVQFRKDAHSSYRLYSQEVDPTRIEGASHSHHFLGIARQFFWAIIEKLTPARRVLLLIALALVI